MNNYIGRRVRDVMTGKTGVVIRDLAIFVVVKMDDGSKDRHYTWSQLRFVD